MNEIPLDMQNVCAEDTNSQDLCTAHRVQLQQPRPLVAGDRVIGLRGFDQVQEKVIRRIGGLMFARDRIGPDGCAVKVIQHVANVMWLKSVAELWSPTSGADFIDLMSAG